VSKEFLLSERCPTVSLRSVKLFSLVSSCSFRFFISVSREIICNCFLSISAFRQFSVASAFMSAWIFCSSRLLIVFRQSLYLSSTPSNTSISLDASSNRLISLSKFSFSSVISLKLSSNLSFSAWSFSEFCLKAETSFISLDNSTTLSFRFSLSVSCLALSFFALENCFSISSFSSWVAISSSSIIPNFCWTFFSSFSIDSMTDSFSAIFPWSCSAWFEGESSRVLFGPTERALVISDWDPLAISARPSSSFSPILRFAAKTELPWTLSPPKPPQLSSPHPSSISASLSTRWPLSFLGPSGNATEFCSGGESWSPCTGLGVAISSSQPPQPSLLAGSSFWPSELFLSPSSSSEGFSSSLSSVAPQPPQPSDSVSGSTGNFSASGSGEPQPSSPSPPVAASFSWLSRGLAAIWLTMLASLTLLSSLIASSAFSFRFWLDIFNSLIVSLSVIWSSFNDDLSFLTESSLFSNFAFSSWRIDSFVLLLEFKSSISFSNSLILSDEEVENSPWILFSSSFSFFSLLFSSDKGPLSSLITTEASLEVLSLAFLFIWASCCFTFTISFLHFSLKLSSSVFVFSWARAASAMFTGTDMSSGASSSFCFSSLIISSFSISFCINLFSFSAHSLSHFSQSASLWLIWFWRSSIIWYLDVISSVRISFSDFACFISISKLDIFSLNSSIWSFSTIPSFSFNTASCCFTFAKYFLHMLVNFSFFSFNRCFSLIISALLEFANRSLYLIWKDFSSSLFFWRFNSVLSFSKTNWFTSSCLFSNCVFSSFILSPVSSICWFASLATSCLNCSISAILDSRFLFSSSRLLFLLLSSSISWVFKSNSELISSSFAFSVSSHIMGFENSCFSSSCVLWFSSSFAFCSS